MRLLYLCADRGIPLLGFKGASTHVRAISSALQARGHAVTVACSRLGSGNPPPAVEHVTQVDTTATRLAELIEETGVDAVIERYSLGATNGLDAARQVDVPLVLEVNAPLVREAARYRGFTDVDAGLADERRLFTGATAVTVVSRALQRYVRQIAPDADVRWVPNGVDLEQFAPDASTPDRGEIAPPGATVVGFVGTMKPWHGVSDLMTAFCAVAPERPDLELVVGGSGPEEQAVRTAVPRELSGRVRLLGAVAHAAVPGILARFDIAVAPYRPDEEFYFCPLKVLEYLAAGLPVVYPVLGDIPELVGPGGRPFPAGDVNTMAEAILELADDASLRARLGALARGAACRWTWDRAAAAVEQTVLEALGAPTG